MTPASTTPKKRPTSPRRSRSTTPRAGKPPGSRRRSELAADLARELQALRTTAKDVVESWSLRVNALLLNAVSRVTPQTDGSTAPLPPRGNLEKALAAVRAVKLKPKKGRAKDLARIQRIAEQLAERLGGEG